MTNEEWKEEGKKEEGRMRKKELVAAAWAIYLRAESNSSFVILNS
jgi:hypothetical protein